MPKSKNCGRSFFIDKAKEHAIKQKYSQQAFDSFLNGVNCVLDELDGKTVVMDRDSRSGDFVNAGTITGSFSWAMRNIKYKKSTHNGR